MREWWQNRRYQSARPKAMGCAVVQLFGTANPAAFLRDLMLASDIRGGVLVW
jgi:hypothetical protein